MEGPAANDKLWLVDLEQLNATRLTSGGGNDTGGVLSADGRFVLFSSDRAGGGYRFYRAPLNGGTPAEVLMEGTGRIYSVSYPARTLGFAMDTGRDGQDAYVIAISEDGAPVGKPVRVAGGPGDQDSPAISADGALVAYQSVESGRPGIYVALANDPGRKRRVTSDGGGPPFGAAAEPPSSTSATTRSSPPLWPRPPSCVSIRRGS